MIKNMKIFPNKPSLSFPCIRCIVFFFGMCVMVNLSLAQSPTSFGKRVKGLPENYQTPNPSTNMIDEQPKSKIPWVVFSDRADNNTTTSPGGSLMMEKLEFLQPFYVSDEKEGYVKLLKYQDNMVKGVKLKNKKSAESVGWIAKDKLLLWQKSFVDTYSSFPYKYLTIINDIDPLVNAAYYLDRTDSIFVYDGPDLKNVRDKVQLHNYVYVFKKSSNGKQFLIGTSDQFVTRHADRFVKGWVSASVVENWGGRVYVTPGYFEEPDLNRAVETINTYNLNKNEPYAVDPLVDSTNLALSGIALPPSARSGNLSAMLPVNVYNKDSNKLLTINGSEMTFPAFLNLIKNRSKVNIVFVIDGGGTMKNHFNSLLSTIQSFESTVSSYFNPRAVKFGSVVYRQGNSCGVGMGRLPLTSDYRQLMTFLRTQAEAVANCRTSDDSQPVFAGLEQAVGLVADVPQQTNLFVVIGSTGNLGGTNSAQLSSLSRRIADVDGRLLVMQSHNRSASGYTDFIVDGRKLVSSEAYYAAEQRKFQLVEGESFGNQAYDFNITDSISYYLDFPNASLVQGGVVFPSRGASLQAKSYQAAVTRFLKETKWDIHHHLNSLDSAFRLTGIENKNVSSSVRALLRDKFNAEVGDNMPHNVFKFASPIQLSSTLLTDSLQKDIAFHLVLNQNEYNEFMDIMNILVGANLQGDDASFRKKLQKNYATVLAERRGRKLSATELNKWSLAMYMEQVLGIPQPLFPYKEETVKALNHNKTMSLPEFESYIVYLQQTITAIKSYAQGYGKFSVNDETYYQIRGDLFMQKPTIDGSN